MQDSSDQFAWLFDALKRNYQTRASWAHIAESFCRVAKFYDKMRNQQEVQALLIDSLIFLLDESFHSTLVPDRVAECSNSLFRLVKSQTILPILRRLKDRGYYFLAHKGTASLEIIDEAFEKECAFAIANYYRERGDYRLSQYYLAYGRCSLDEMRQNEKLFLSEDRFRQSMKQSWRICAAVFEDFLAYGNDFWALGDFDRANRIYRRLEKLLEEYERDIGRSEEHEHYLTRCLTALSKRPPSDVISVDAFAHSVEAQPLDRHFETMESWSENVRTNIIFLLCESIRKSLGPPPCHFSIVALGSLARSEACLNSDFEFAIIWKKFSNFSTDELKIINYLRRFVFLLELKIIALGETRNLGFLPSCLSPDEERSCDLVQERRNRGLQFDDAANYPFRTLDNTRFVFNVGSPLSLEAFQKLDDLITFNIVEALVVYPDEKKEDLLGILMSQLRPLIDEEFVDKVMLHLYPEPIDENPLAVDIKKHLLAPAQWGIKAMSLYYGIEERNTLLRIDALVKKHILIPEAGALLKKVIVTALQLRMKSHRDHQSEYDLLPVDQAEDIALRPFILKFFDAWHENPEGRHFGAELVHDVWMYELSREIVSSQEITDVCIHGLFEAPQYLKREWCEQWIESTTGEFKEELRAVEDGRRITVPVGEVAFVKVRPEGPGMQRAVSRFCNQFAGNGLPVKLCFFEYAGKKALYPVLFSAPRGETLLKKRRRGESLKDLDPQIDHYYFSLRIFEWLLLHLEDVKDDNVTFLNKRFHLVDDDHALVESVVEIREYLTRILKLQAKSILPCFDAIKDKPIDPEAKEWFLTLNPGQFIKQWLTSLVIDEEQYKFTRAQFLVWAENITDASIVPWLLEPGMVSDLYARFHRLRGALKSTEEDAPVTLLDMICRVEPHMGAIYKEVFNPAFKLDTPEDRFRHLRTNYKMVVESDAVVKFQSQHVVKERVARSISLPPESKSKPTLRKLFEGGVFYTPRKALQVELPGVEYCYQMRRQILDGLHDGTCSVANFQKLPGFLREYVINRLDWLKIELENQKALLLSLPGLSLRELTLNNCDGLDNDILIQILKTSPELRVVEVLNCNNVTGTVVRDIAAMCPRLVRLDVSGTNISSITTRVFGDVVFPELRRLKTENCLLLQEVHVEAPELLAMTASGCVSLEVLRLNTPDLQNLNLTRCLVLQSQQLAQILKRSQKVGCLLGEQCPAVLNIIGTSVFLFSEWEEIFTKCSNNLSHEDSEVRKKALTTFEALGKLDSLKVINKFLSNLIHENPEIKREAVVVFKKLESKNFPGFRKFYAQLLTDLSSENFYSRQLARWILKDLGKRDSPEVIEIYIKNLESNVTDICSEAESQLERIRKRSIFGRLRTIVQPGAVRGSAVKERSDTLYSSESLLTNTQSQGYDYLFKVALIGSDSVGKSSILLRYTNGRFSFHQDMTIGVEFCSKTLRVENSNCKLQLWDTAGQEMVRTIVSSHFRNCHGFILIFDLSRKETLCGLRSRVGEELQVYSESLFLVVGNKADIEERVVSREEAEAFAQEIGSPYFEVSAKTGENVTEVFETLAKMIYEKTVLGKSFDQISQETSVTTRDIAPHRQDFSGLSRAIVSSKSKKEMLRIPTRPSRQEFSMSDSPDLRGINARFTKNANGFSLRLSTSKKDLSELKQITEECVRYFKSRIKDKKVEVVNGDISDSSITHSESGLNEFFFKIMLIGRTYSGKSSLALRFVDNVFPARVNTRIGPSFYNKQMRVMENVIRVQVWVMTEHDIFAGEKLEALYFKNTDGFLLAVDLTSRRSLFRVVEFFEKIAERELPQSNLFSPIILVGLKADLSEKRNITREEAELVARALTIPYFEVSAKNNILVEETFDALVRMMLENSLCTTISFNNVAAKSSFNNEKCKDFVEQLGATVDTSFRVNCPETARFSNVEILRKLIKTFEKLEGPDSLTAFWIAYRHRSNKHPQIAEEAIETFERLKNSPKFIQEIFKSLSHEDDETRGLSKDVLEVLAKLEPLKIIRSCIENMACISPLVRAGVYKALKELYKLNSPEIIQAYTANLEHKDPEIRQEAEEALAKIKSFSIAHTIPKTNSPIHSPPTPRVSAAASSNDPPKPKRNSMGK